MSWSKGTDKLTQPNEGLTKRHAIKRLALRLLPGNSHADKRNGSATPATRGGVIPLAQGKTNLQTVRDAVYKNYRHVQIR